MATASKPSSAPAPAGTPAGTPSAPPPPAQSQAPGTPVLIKGFTSPFRRIQQAERMDDAFACIAMLVHQPLSDVAEAAYGLGYPRQGPALITEALIAKLLIQRGQLVSTTYKDFISWDALPDVALVYVDYDEEMEVGRHVLWHHVRASPQQNALSYVIDPAHWIKPELGVTQDFKRYDAGWYIEVRHAGKTSR